MQHRHFEHGIYFVGKQSQTWNLMPLTMTFFLLSKKTRWIWMKNYCRCGIDLIIRLVRRLCLSKVWICASERNSKLSWCRMWNGTPQHPRTCGAEIRKRGLKQWFSQAKTKMQMWQLRDWFFKCTGMKRPKLMKKWLKWHIGQIGLRLSGAPCLRAALEIQWPRPACSMVFGTFLKFATKMEPGHGRLRHHWSNVPGFQKPDPKDFVRAAATQASLWLRRVKAPKDFNKATSWVCWPLQEPVCTKRWLKLVFWRFLALNRSWMRGPWVQWERKRDGIHDAEGLNNIDGGETQITKG